jgi:UDP-GlcNAc3NAcA epimerase
MQACIVVGARPQFIKAAELVHGGTREGLAYSIVHTGQHYDQLLSEVFFDELNIPAPDTNLGVGSGAHGWQTGEIMRRLEAYLVETEIPDAVVVFGDTNSTIAGAIAAAKLGVPVVHVEAGLRSYDRFMPEEINRVVTDRLSSLLCCPSDLAVSNLEDEGIHSGVHNTGDIMYDSVVRYRSAIETRASDLSGRKGARPWALATIHRASNTDNHTRLEAALACLEAAEMPVVWPIHPRTRKKIEEWGGEVPSNVRLVNPASYLDMLAHISAAGHVLTDSGGIQKEAFWLGTPCITLRDTTEWKETANLGWNVIVGIDPKAVRNAVNRELPSRNVNPYGDGQSAQTISELILSVNDG